MSTVKRRLKASSLSPGTDTLLAELGEECQHVLKLLAQLEIPGLKLVFRTSCRGFELR
jgi:3'-phosphoadenosine 5'-phosphosulfate sulfotransferase